MTTNSSTETTTPAILAAPAAGGRFLLHVLVLAGLGAAGGCVSNTTSTPEANTSYTPRGSSNSAARAPSARPAGPAVVAPAAQQPLPDATRTISAGTGMSARLDTTLDSSVASVGDDVRATLTSDVHDSSGRIALPTGTTLSGHVTDVQPARKVHKMASLAFRFNRATLADGTAVGLSASEGINGRGWTKKQGAIIGGSAAGGAVLGQVIGHDSQSTVGGAILGGAIATGVIMSNKGEDVVLSSGSTMELALDGDVAVPAPTAS